MRDQSEMISIENAEPFTGAGATLNMGAKENSSTTGCPELLLQHPALMDTMRLVMEECLGKTMSTMQSPHANQLGFEKVLGIIHCLNYVSIHQKNA